MGVWDARVQTRTLLSTTMGTVEKSLGWPAERMDGRIASEFELDGNVLSFASTYIAFTMVQLYLRSPALISQYIG